MKRLGFFVVVGVALLAFVGHRRHHAWADRGPQPLPTMYEFRTHSMRVDAQGRPIQLAQNNKPPTPPKVHRKALPKDRDRPAAPSVPPAQVTTVDPKVMPDWYPKTHEEEEARAKVDNQGNRVLVSQLAGTDIKARADLRLRVDREVAQWLSGDVAPGWKPPTNAIDGLIQATYTQPVIEDVGSISKDLDDLVTIYRAAAKLNFSPGKRAQLVSLYDQQVVHERMIKGGGVLAFVLIALASLSGYIRADEATKGYYTNRLRLLTATGVGAAGVVLYQMFT